MPKGALKAIALTSGVAALIALISMFETGFRFGVSNNVFHVPVVLGLAQSPEFSDDAFYESLRNFTTVVWPVLAALANESNVESLFLVTAFLARVATFAALLWLAMAQGLKPVAAVALPVLAIAVSPWMQGSSLVGDHGMFLDYLSHSELTWPLVFVFLLQLCRGNAVWSGAAAGAMFCINAFVGVWVLLASAPYILVARWRQAGWLVRFCCAVLLCASPVLVWMARVLTGDSAAGDFSFREYVRLYYPDHFLIESASPWALRLLLLVVVNGLLACTLMENARFWLFMLCGFTAVLVAGIPLPYLVDDRLVFNLHLVRSAGLLQAVALVLAMLAGARLALKGGDPLRRCCGVVVMLALAIFEMGTLSALLVTLALLAGMADVKPGLLSRFPSPPHLARFLAIVAIAGFFLLAVRGVASGSSGLLVVVANVAALVVVVLWMLRVPAPGDFGRIACGAMGAGMLLVAASGAVDHRQAMLAEKQDVQAEDWNDLVSHVRASELRGPFLVPVQDRRFNLFQLRARRTVWVDWKQGAAVMWSPAFHGQWERRIREVSALSSTAEFAQYARERDIRNFILQGDGAECPAPAHTLYSNRHYQLCRLDG